MGQRGDGQHEEGSIVAALALARAGALSETISGSAIPKTSAMFACRGRLLPRPAEQAVVMAPGGYRVRSLLFQLDTDCRKRLRSLELALLHGSGSRKAAGAVLWFTKPSIWRSKDRGFNLNYSAFAACFMVLDENLCPAMPRSLLSCMEHAIIGRLIISLHRKGQEI